MKHVFLIIYLILLSAFAVVAQTNDISIVPKPTSVTKASGNFTFDQKTKIVATDKVGREMAGLLNDLLIARYGFKIEFTDKPQAKNAIIFEKVKNGHGDWHSINFTNNAVTISGGEAGMFYAVRTLMQLLPSEYKGSVAIPAMRIDDKPRFRYRGMHLDVSRHFMPVSFVKKYIDLMSQYKLNYFHWHLTDDQGWRIEIKKYPKLTEIGSKRPESHEGRYSTTFKGDGRPVEGFYTQEEIKDVVRYAKSRHITVVPEIELPGHASAALAAYPELGKGCAAPDYKFEVKKTWGIFKEVFCPTEETFKFLEDVLDETIKLFPDSPYVHIGGDEVLKDYWKESAYVQELKKRENLKDEHEVQSYFVRRMEKFVNSKGKKIIGWDEILEGGIAPNATIMSWRGMKGGIEAAKQKHDVIMTPTDHVYFDYSQGDPAFEPLNIGGYVPLSKVYAFNPVPAELNAEEAKYIIGGQANMWTEYLETPAAVEYMAFPRMLALAEVVWSQQEGRDFSDFQRRLASQFPLLDKQNVNYRIPEPEGLQNIVTKDATAVIELKPFAGTRVFYTTDGTTPTESSTQYTKPIEVSLNDGEVKTLKTIVVNGVGRKSVIYTATVVRGQLHEANDPAPNKDQKPGVDVSILTGHEGGTIKFESRSITLGQLVNRTFPRPSNVRFNGMFVAPADGVYEFQLESTQPSIFSIRGASINNDEEGSSAVRSILIPLKKGTHPILLRTRYVGPDQMFRLRYGIKGRGMTQAWGGEFVH